MGIPESEEKIGKDLKGTERAFRLRCRLGKVDMMQFKKVSGKPMRSFQANVPHQRSLMSPRNRPVLVSLPYSVTGWEQSVGSAAWNTVIDFRAQYVEYISQ